MNNNLHRIIFSHSRGQRMVVAETASAQGKAASGNTAGVVASPGLQASLHPLRFAMLSALGLMLWLQPAAFTSVHAQVIADPSAPANQRPTILQTANGLPLVNIQTASQGGVSRNTYIQFDVPQGGVILNNSRSNVQTQLGGFVGANPWLANGAARVILNEVNSSNPSQIRGYVEVAGQRAEVIIANPAGINVNGGGFLNASRVTLTTGSPVLNSGALEAFRVQGGSVTVDGAGLDTSTADYTAILARAVQVNAGIWAKELRVVAGANQVDAAQGSATAIAGTGPAPTYAIDVAQVGGMYAGKIFLIGTETGLGVRNAGTIGATGGDLVLQSNGWLTNSGNLLASGNIQSATTGLTTNSGTIYANGNTTVAGQAGVGNIGSATLGAQGSTTVQATGAGAQVSSATGAVIAAGLNTDGSIAASGNLSISAADAVTVSGKALAGGNASVSGSQLNLADSTLLGQGVSLTATAGDIDASRANIKAIGLLATSTAQTLRTDAATVVAGQLGLAAGSLSNLGGQITQTGTASGSVSMQGQINNTGGRLASNGNTTLQAQSLANQGGTVQTTGSADLAITTTGMLGNAAGGQLAAGGNLTINAASITNAGKLLAGSTLTASATDLDNAITGEITGATTQLTATNSLTNRGLIDGQITRLTAPVITNTGTGRIFGDTLSIAATTLNNTPETIAGVTKAGVIAARNRLDIGAGTVNNGIGALIFSAGTGANALNIGGSLDATQQATGLAQAVNNAGGTIESLGGLTIAAAQINNTNPDFAYTLQSTPGTQTREYITGQGIYTTDDIAWELGTLGLAGHGGYLYADGRQGRFLLKGAAYSQTVYKPYYGGTDAYVAEHYVRVGAGDSAVDEYVPPAFSYPSGHPVWAVFGVASPGTGMPGPKPVGRAVSSGDGEIMLPPDPVEMAAWNAATAPWMELQSRINAFRATVNATAITFDGFRDYSQAVPSATITRSTPGRILSGGAMTLNARDALLNDQAQIIAGGALNITGQAVDNRGRSITVNAQRTGTAYAWSNYNEGCGGWDGCDYNYNAYRDSAYVQDVPKTFVLDVNRSQGMTAPSSLGLTSGTVVNGATITGGAAALPASANSLTVPSNSLFRVTPNPVGNFIVETDPRFANYRNWLGSDYMLNALGLDPATTQKRLGDGFYEQRLVNEQVAQLTGQRFLANYTSEEVQYKALMDAGVTFAQQFQLRPGVALTAAQVAQLTSDIVWLVEQDVTVPDGRGGTLLVKALVPVVYVVPRTGDLNGKGVLLAGREVNLNLSGDLTNSGTVAGRTVVSLTAENVHNISGRITGDAVAVAARTDINNTGGTIDAASSLSAIAGRDINLTTTTTSATNRTDGIGRGTSNEVNAYSNNTFSMTGIDRVAGLYVTGNTAGAPGTLVASAGRDINLIAAVIGNNSTSGSTTLAAGNNINLATVTTANSSDQRRGDDDFVRDAQTQEVGSQIQAAGSLTLNAGNDLDARAASVQATGDLSVTAGNSVNLSAGRQTHSSGFGLTTSESDIFGSSSTKESRSTDQDNATGSSLGGKTVTIVSGKDIRVLGSAVISDTGTTLAAGRNIAIEAAQNTSASTYYYEKKESGLFQEGFSYDTSEQSTDRKNRGATAAASTVGSIGGNVTLVANDVYKQVGSDVMAPKGDITIAAKTVNILEARESRRDTTEEKTSQSGVGITFSNPILSAIAGVQQTADSIKATSQTQDSRAQALGTAATALNAYNTANQVMAIANNPAAAASFGINLSIGGSKTQSNTDSSSDTAAGSTVAAGGDIIIAATGAGLDSNLTVQGSRITADNNARLLADNQVKMLAAEQRATERNSNTSSGASIGIGFSVGAQNGFTLNASASVSKGQGNGDELSYTNTQVQAGNQLTVTSGGDTQLIGAVAAAKQVTVQAGGDLIIQSLQDQSVYKETQSSAGAGVSLCIPPFCYGSSSGSVSGGKSNINSNYQSVGQQSAIRAGDGGFSVAVGGDTALAGGQITSTQKAVDDGKNSFQTGGALTLTDIQNVASYEGSGYQLGAGLSGALGDQSSPGAIADMRDRGMSDAQIQGASKAVTSPGGSAGYGQTSGDASSTTTAGISGIAGNTGARTGDAETSLKPIFDKDKVKADIAAQIALTAAFGRDASKAVGDYAEARLQEAKDLRSKADQTSNEAMRDSLLKQADELYDNWGPNGTLRVAAHTIIGGLTGGANGALGAAVGTLTAPAAAQALAASDIDGPLATILTALASTAAGAITGGGVGAGTAFNEVTNNYLKHDEAIRLALLKEKKLLGRCDQGCEKDIATLQALDEMRNAQIQSCSGVTSSTCDTVRQDLRSAAAEYVRKSSILMPAIRMALNNIYVEERDETWQLAESAMTGVGSAKALGILTTIKDGLVALGSAGLLGYEALVKRDPLAQDQVMKGAGAAWTFVSDPANWPELMGAMSPADREKLARAYETGDGLEVGMLLGNQIANMPTGGGMGTIKKIDKAIDLVATAKIAALKAEGLEVAAVKAGSKGAWEKTINGVLDPNTAYIVDTGHTYITDSAGRVNSVVGDLNAIKMDRNTYQQACAGRCGDLGDQGGHLIAATLGGAGEKINLVPQAASLNNGSWKIMENEFKTALDAGKKVTVKIEVGYPASGGVRPNSFNVTATIDGKVVPYRFTQ